MTPDEYTNQEFFLDVGDGHQLYVQDWGNPKAKLPIIYLHGGPGVGCNDKHKRVFDPTIQRVIFHDQRGSGKSLPYGSLDHNTTSELVEDVEKLISRFGIEKFVLTGGSWGSCLALAYALKYPSKLSAIVLRGVFTGSKAEIDYLCNGGFASHFPEVWDTYLDATPKQYRDDPSAYHIPRILGKDPTASQDSAYAYSNLESALISIDDRYTAPDSATFENVFARIETHYLSQSCFMPDRHILNNAHDLKVPVWIVQGRYDFICPPVTAYELHSKLPDSRLQWTQSGHSSGDRDTYEVMRALLLELTRT